MNCVSRLTKKSAYFCDGVLSHSSTFPFVHNLYLCDDVKQKEPQVLLGTRVTRVTGFFLSVSFYVHLWQMGIVSWLLTVSGLDSLFTNCQQLWRVFDFLSGVLKWFGLLCLSFLSRILGRLAGLVLFLLETDLYFMLPCSCPLWMIHLRRGCQSPRGAEPYNHNVVNKHTIHKLSKTSRILYGKTYLTSPVYRKCFYMS